MSDPDKVVFTFELEGCLFYDLPLQVTNEDIEDTGDVQHQYGPIPGPCRWVPSPDPGTGTWVTLYYRGGARYGTGRWFGSLESATDLYHVVKLDWNGSLVIWPNHKTRVGQHGVDTALPKWQKNRYKHFMSATHVEGMGLALRAAMLAEVRSFILGAPDTDWRHHGLGCLQGYLDADLRRRVHLWHPDLVRPLVAPIHTHRWDLDSMVLYGAVVQEEYEAHPHPHGPYTVHTTRHTGSGEGAQVSEGRYAVTPHTRLIKAGERYYMARGLYHLTRVWGPAVTLVTRDGVTEDLSRVLAPYGEPTAPNGVQPWTAEIDPTLNLFRRIAAGWVE